MKPIKGLNEYPPWRYKICTGPTVFPFGISLITFRLCTCIVWTWQIFLTLEVGVGQSTCRRKINNAFTLFICGVIVILLNSWISYNAKPSFFITGLRVLLEPAGWFSIWVAFDFVFYDFPELRKERRFYKKLSEMNIHFRSSWRQNL